MSDRDCVHGALARSCQVCDLEAVLDEVQEALTWAEAPVRHDGGYLTLAERVRWLHLRGRDRHRERDEARAEVRKLRAERAVMLDVIRVADVFARRADRTEPLWAMMPRLLADLDAALDRVYALIGDDDE